MNCHIGNYGLKKLSSSVCCFGLKHVFNPTVEKICDTEHHIAAGLNIMFFKPSNVRRAYADPVGEVFF
jgi:hypothetical protein